MRSQIVVIGLLQAAMLVACNDRSALQTRSELARDRGDGAFDGKAASAPRPASEPVLAQEQVASQAPSQWSYTKTYDAMSRMIIRTGQASIEVDSLELSMAELRQIVQRTGGFVADASV